MTRISRKTIKRGIIVIIIMAIFLFLLDFIPVKFAKRIDSSNNEDMITHNPNRIDIIATYSKKTGAFEYPWEAYYYQDSVLRIVKFNVSGNNPYQALSRRDFYKNAEWMIDIRFILNGNLQMEGEKENVGKLNVSTWEMVYPIKRQSIRKHYVPKSYLTIYDFDWISVIKSWFAKCI